MAIIEFNNIEKYYGNKEILNELSFKIEEGEMVAITGPSGSGKSTVLNIIGLLEDFSNGSYRLDGEDNIKINSSKSTIILRNKINYLFQNFALIDEQTVSYNLELAFKYLKRSKKEKNEEISKVLSEVGLVGYEKRKIYELSGGEQQRVAIARCMLKPCKIVLADEPTGSLDPKNAKVILDLLKKLHEKGKTIIVVTHDKFIADSCDRIINLVIKNI